jgi:hypothetical protein
MLEAEAMADRNSTSRDHRRKTALIAGEPKAPSVAVLPVGPTCPPRNHPAHPPNTLPPARVTLIR